MSAMTITHGAGDGLPAVGDYISEDFLQVLEVSFSLKNTVITIKQEHRKLCEREGKFNEAQTARKRLKELRKLEEQRKLKKAGENKMILSEM